MKIKVVSVAAALSAAVMLLPVCTGAPQSQVQAAPEVPGALRAVGNVYMQTNGVRE